MRLFVRFCGLALLCGLLIAARAVAQEPAEPDPRLSKTVTLSETGVTLAAALAKASELTGVTMKTDPDSRQWKVRDLPLSLRLKDVPASGFQVQLGKLLDLRWTRTGQAPNWTYTLWQDANARSREAKALTAAQDAKLATAEAKWRKITDAISAAGGMSAADLEKQGASKPFLKFLSQNEFGKSYAGLMSGLAGAALPSLAAGETFRAPYSSLPRSVQQNVQGFVNGLNSFASMAGGGAQASAPGNWQAMTVMIRPMPANVGQGVLDRLGMLGFIQIDGGGSSGEGRPPIPMVFPIVDPSSEIASMIGTGAERIANGENPRDVMRDMGPKAGQVARTAAEAPPAAETAQKAASKAPNDPRLQKEVEIKAAKGGDLTAALDTISEKTTLAIIAEGWKYSGVNIKEDKGPAADVLDRLTAAIGAEWELDGGSIRIRAKDWAARRAAMVAAEDLGYWKSRVDANGNIGLDDLALMAGSYSDEQIARIRESDEKVRSATFYLTVPPWRPALRFYGMLSEQQAAQARTGQGLDVSSLSREQRDGLAGAVEQWGSKAQADVLVAGSRIRVKEDGGTTYLVVPGEGEEGVDIPLVRKRTAPEETKAQPVN